MAGNVTELNAENFDEFIKNDRVVVDFWAPWCGPCKMLGPVFEEAAGELGDQARFGKVNVDENSDLAQRFQVMSIPTMIFFRDGQQEERSVGVISKEDIAEKIKALK